MLKKKKKKKNAKKLKFIDFIIEYFLYIIFYYLSDICEIKLRVETTVFFERFNFLLPLLSPNHLVFIPIYFFFSHIISRFTFILVIA